MCVCKQAFQASLMVANNEDMCTQVLASKLDKPFVNYVSHGPWDPMLTSMYPNSNCRTFIPLLLSYLPILGSTVDKGQRLVSSRLRCGCSWLHLAWGSHPIQHCTPAASACGRTPISKSATSDTLWHSVFEYAACRHIAVD